MRKTFKIKLIVGILSKQNKGKGLRVKPKFRVPEAQGTHTVDPHLQHSCCIHLLKLFTRTHKHTAYGVDAIHDNLRVVYFTIVRGSAVLRLTLRTFLANGTEIIVDVFRSVAV